MIEPNRYKSISRIFFTNNSHCYNCFPPEKLIGDMDFHFSKSIATTFFTQPEIIAEFQSKLVLILLCNIGKFPMLLEFLFTCQMPVATFFAFVISEHNFVACLYIAGFYVSHNLMRLSIGITIFVCAFTYFIFNGSYIFMIQFSISLKECGDATVH